MDCIDESLMNLSVFGVSQVGARFRFLGNCSNCPLYPKCKGIGLQPDNPDDNPDNPRKNPDNPCKDCKIKKEK